MIVTYDVVDTKPKVTAKYKHEYRLVEEFANSDHHNMCIECDASDNFHSLRVAMHGHLKQHYPRLKMHTNGRALYITRKEIK